MAFSANFTCKPKIGLHQNSLHFSANIWERPKESSPEILDHIFKPHAPHSAFYGVAKQKIRRLPMSLQYNLSLTRLNK